VIPLIGKDDIIKSRRALKKSKNNKYGYMKKQALELASKIYTEIEKDGATEISLIVTDIAKEFGIVNRSNATIYTGLRYLLFFEGIDVSIRNDGKRDILRLKPINGYGYGLPESSLKTFDNVELGGWYIKRKYLGMSFVHSIVKRRNIDKEDNNSISNKGEINDSGENNGSNMYTLESYGSIHFDRRDLTEEQAVEFVKYMSGKNVRAPDFVYLTPINLVISDEYMNLPRFYKDIDFDKIGREFRIVRLGGDQEFAAVSIYGKECTVYEYDIDEMVKGCSIHRILYSFDQALMIEKTPERVEILKRLLPEIKTKHSVVIRDHTLVIINSSGTFHLSLTDGTLHKIYVEAFDTFDIEKRYNSKYICVGPRGNTENFIVFKGKKYKIDATMGAILSKTVMLLEEKYPDARTVSQIRS
jgi:hypothetical protein